MSFSRFYRAFEERHRGSRELIGTRLEVYLPFIAPLAVLYQPAMAIDLGCGRGEWLELLQREGFEPSGVDLDDGMLQACRERGLSVVRGDAIEHLKSLPDASHCVVSGFHFAEHIAFDELQTLVVESLRVLKPAGLLILETPNPENLVVGTSSFYLDPTHVRPLPPLLMSFLPEHHGYKRVQIVRLQEAAELRSGSEVQLFDVLAGVSPDYSIVAQKDGPSDLLEHFGAAFEQPHGVQLSELAGRHDANVAQRLAAFDQRLVVAEAHAGGMTDALARIAALQERLVEATADAGRAKAKIESLEGELNTAHQQQNNAEIKLHQLETVELAQLQKQLQKEAQTREKLEQRAIESDLLTKQQNAQIDEIRANTHHWWLQAQGLERECNALRASLSWRATGPLRWGASFVVKDKSAGAVAANSKQPGGLAATVVQRPLAEAMRVVLRNPAFAYGVNQQLLRFPPLHRWLVSVAKNKAVVPHASAVQGSADTPALINQARTDFDLVNLTPHARQIHHALKTAIGRARGSQT